MLQGVGLMMQIQSPAIEFDKYAVAEPHKQGDR